MLLFVAQAAWANGYAVGPGDVLEIKVFGDKELSRDYEVAQNGTIRLPWIKEVEVKGLTTRVIEKRLEERLGEDYLVDPQVSVVVKEYKSKKIYVLGHVKNPGAYSLTGDTRVLEALAMAGGVGNEGGKSFTIIKGGAELGPGEVRKLMTAPDDRAIEDFTQGQPNARVIHVDGYALMEQGDLTQNQALDAGDILSVPKASFVYFDGEVNKPGPVTYSEGLTMMKAISLAGGLTKDAGRRVVVTRSKDGKNETISLNLSKISKHEGADFTLLPDDVVKVKRSWF
ncbi:MAG: SLBB domain-containing protein [Deltaproteobacteria bacterium]|nr:SLBB domain-containing protein [Deltaproteobacteria bacterium]